MSKRPVKLSPMRIMPYLLPTCENTGIYQSWRKQKKCSSDGSCELANRINRYSEEGDPGLRDQKIPLFSIFFERKRQLAAKYAKCGNVAVTDPGDLEWVFLGLSKKEEKIAKPRKKPEEGLFKTSRLQYCTQEEKLYPEQEHAAWKRTRRRN